jgi:hypothetical protein
MEDGDLRVLCESDLEFNEKNPFLHLVCFSSFDLVLKDLNHSSRLRFSTGSRSVSFFSR